MNRDSIDLGFSTIVATIVVFVIGALCIGGCTGYCISKYYQNVKQEQVK